MLTSCSCEYKSSKLTKIVTKFCQHWHFSTDFYWFGTNWNWTNTGTDNTGKSHVNIRKWTCCEDIQLLSLSYTLWSLADLRGGGCQGCAPSPGGPNSFIFTQFSAIVSKVIPLWELAPLPQKNPRSATSDMLWFRLTLTLRLLDTVPYVQETISQLLR